MKYTMMTAALLLSFGAASPALATAPGALVAQAEPTVDEILNASLEAMGGRKAIDQIKTLHVSSKMSSTGMEMEADWKWSKGGGRMITYITPMGEIKQGTDGKIGWSHNAMTGYVLASEEELEQMDNQAGLHMALADIKKTLLEDSEQLEYLGQETFASHNCHKIYHLDNDGTEGHLFFSIDTNLPVGFRTVPEDGTTADEMIISDWKKLKGVHFFHGLEMRSGNPNSPGATMTITKIDVNTLEDDVFEVPQEVKDLAKQAEADADAPDIKLSDLTSTHQAQAQQMIDGARQAPGTEPLKQMIGQLEGAIRFMQGDDKKMYQYVVQELKKELKNRGG